LDYSRWDENLVWLQFAFNTARHEAHKDSPFSLMMSFTSNSPLSNLWSIKDLLPDDPDNLDTRPLGGGAQESALGAPLCP
jgi:hypothetical protein